MGWRIGVDIGGTFTDVAVLDEASGRVGIAKLSTTPHDFGAAVVEGTRAAMDTYRIAPDAVSFLSHATTIVTNALLESKGANVALVATRGFRDVLELRRSARADLYDLFQDAPAVLVPRRQRFEVTERVDAQGEIVTALDEAELDALVDAIRGLDGVQAIAVCLMFSFLNDVHEQRIGERLRAALPGLPVFLSSENPARDPRVRAHEHDRGMRLRGAGARLLPRTPGDGPRRARSPGAPRHGVERRGPGRGRGARDARRRRRVRARGRGHRRAAAGRSDRPREPHLLRHGRHHRQGEPDRERPHRDHLRVRGGRPGQRRALAARHRAILSACRSSIWRR